MRTDYAHGTYMESHDGTFACGFKSARALCSDGIIRKVRFSNGGIADTFFSVPCSVGVNGKTVSGFVEIGNLEGLSTSDEQLVRFHAVKYGKNHDALPAEFSRDTPAMSVKTAKAIAMERFGRLPRMGYEMDILTQEEARAVINLDDRRIVRRIPVTYTLEHNGNGFRVREYNDWGSVPLRGIF